MTDQEFLDRFSSGLNVRDQTVTARVDRGQGNANHPRLVITVNEKDDLPVGFEPQEDFDSRMAKVERAVERWLMREGREG